jgi:predicted  nucleic acid-binding Zn-ribbon protein
MNPEIESIREKIEVLQTKLVDLMHNCPHTDGHFYKGKTSGSYYDNPEDYIYLNCPDCGIKFTYYKGEDSEYNQYINRI